jgi:hypothetical protein
MSRGPTHIPSRGACIYCRATGVRLTDEHVVPLSLGGGHVLQDASCDKCADITKKFEQRVARDLWGDARVSFNGPSRRKSKRPSHIWMENPDDRSKPLKLPASEYPAGLVFYKMGRAGLLDGAHPSANMSIFWELVFVDDDKRREAFIARYPKHKLTLQFRHVPDDFGRLLAKIGYCQVLTSLDPVDFRPICLPYIFGTEPNVSYVVGGTTEPQSPQPEFGYSLSTVSFGSPERLMLVALVRLYANTHAPAYHVVVGDVLGAEAVERVVAKLATVDTASTMPDHWRPSVWPLPHWSARGNLG